MVIVATSISAGRLRGLQTVAGTTAGTAILLLVAAAGTAWLATVLAEAFFWIKWLGVAYLAYLGFGHLRAARDASSNAAPAGVAGTFWRGFFVSLSNPKTILFFGAFLPQFVSLAHPVAPQVAILSLTFLALAAVLDGMWALPAGSARALATNAKLRRWRDGLTGFIYLAASLGLAAARRS
jgi:homoserine/homoserine lactone efflux protein